MIQSASAMLPPNALPDDIEALKAALIVAQAEGRRRPGRSGPPIRR